MALSFETVVVRPVEIAVGLVFTLAALGKLRDPAAFVHGVIVYDVLPPPIAKVYGIVLIPLEMIIGVGLLTEWAVGPAAIAGLFLLVSFLLAVGSNVRRHREVMCYCFGGPSKEIISVRSLARIVLLILATSIILFGLALRREETLSITFGKLSVDNSLISSLIQIILALFVIICGMWLLAAPDIIRLRSRASARTR